MRHKIRWALVFYDLLIYLISSVLIIFIYPRSVDNVSAWLAVIHIAIGLLCAFGFRFITKVYKQIWRYAGALEYIRLLFADVAACAVFLILRLFLPHRITFVRSLSLFSISLLGCISIRLIYQWIYQRRASKNRLETLALKTLQKTAGVSFADEAQTIRRINVAIIGAGSVGVTLADELIRNPKAIYRPVCFVDIDTGKAGREIYRIPVLLGGNDIGSKLSEYPVQEVIFALPNIDNERRKELYNLYTGLGYKIKAYDYPILDPENNGKRVIHDFNIEDLLFRHSSQFLTDDTMGWYRGKSVLITGGGGSIGSELARQIARCRPSRLVILDVYENGAHDIQQELQLRYGHNLNIRVEIASVCDREMIEKIFSEHTPDIVLHAAAHKHVPLMERNVIEAVKNNVFGTLNVVEVCEKYGVKRFIMVSTDKAVNPTNVMGATKRMCEMIVQSRRSCTSFSATRFGNVLGSNGSVIPLFKQQIANGGPITITDRRIIRYFMTIPEAAQLVMTSGAMAGNGELYVLDMGKPVKILDLAENMVRLSGLDPYKDIDIIETGLRPGEKLYEELLIKTEEMGRTDNNMIFVERDKPLSEAEVSWKLNTLRDAMASGSNRVVKQALMSVVPTYKTPEEVNRKAIIAEEMLLTS